MDLELRCNNCKIEPVKPSCMKAPSKFYFALALFLSGTLVGCQRGNSQQPTASGSTATTTSTTTETPFTDTTTAPFVNTYDHSIPPTSVEMSYNIIPLEDGTMGYEIYRNGELQLKQESIPTQGKKGFTEKVHAAKAAQLVVDKMIQGIDPPTLSKKEVNDILSGK